MAPSFRVFIDESGDHTYKHLTDLSRRYLGLTAIVVRKTTYDALVPSALEALKAKYLRYDPDDPPILVRQRMIGRKGPFGRLVDKAVNDAWCKDLLAFLSTLDAQVFTVVMDKKSHFDAYATSSWNAYDYSLHVLLNRIRGWLKLRGASADVMPEARGKNEDDQLLQAYTALRTHGVVNSQGVWGTAAEYCAAFPEDELHFRLKTHNVAGLQIADLIAAEQKLLTVEENKRPMPHPIGPFGQQVNAVINGKVNQYGRYLLE